MESKSEKIIQNIFSQGIFKSLDKTKILLRKNHVESINYHNQNILSSIEVKPKSHCEQTIKCIPPEGIIIKKSGKYVLANNIKWHSKCHNVAITICANDVTIDLGGNYLKCIG